MKEETNLTKQFTGISKKIKLNEEKYNRIYESLLSRGKIIPEPAEEFDRVKVTMTKGVVIKLNRLSSNGAISERKHGEFSRYQGWFLFWKKCCKFVDMY